MLPKILGKWGCGTQSEIATRTTRSASGFALWRWLAECDVLYGYRLTLLRCTENDEVLRYYPLPVGVTFCDRR